MTPESAPARYRYATRLNSFRSSSTRSVLDLIAAVARIDGLTAVELNYPQHLAGAGETAVIRAIRDADLALTAISLRYDDPDYALGAFTHPRRDIRARAIRLTCEAIDLAARHGVPHVNVWMAHDGWDYPFAADYAALWQAEIDGFRAIAARDPALRVSVEYKPLEPRRQSLIASMSDALLAVEEVGLPNFGVQIDVCHALMAREHPAAAAAQALRHGRLFGVHLNDGYGPADDGLMVGSVHLTHTLDLLWQLRRFDYRGTIYFDTFPDRVDAAAECAANLRACQRLERILDRLDSAAIAALQGAQDAIGATRALHQALFGEAGDD